jgi:hypothetical protein
MGEVGVCAASAAAAAQRVAGVGDGQHGPDAAQPLVGGRAGHGGRRPRRVSAGRLLLRQQGRLQQQVLLPRVRGEAPLRVGVARAALRMQGLAAQPGAGGAAAQRAGRGAAAAFV